MIGLVFAGITVAAAAKQGSTEKKKVAAREAFGFAQGLPADVQDFLDGLIGLTAATAASEGRYEVLLEMKNAADRSVELQAGGGALSAALAWATRGYLVSPLLTALSGILLVGALIDWTLAREVDRPDLYHPPELKETLAILRQHLALIERNGQMSPEDLLAAQALLDTLGARLDESFGAMAMSLNSGYRDTFDRKGRWPDPAGQGHRGTGRHAVSEHLARASARASMKART